MYMRTLYLARPVSESEDPEIIEVFPKFYSIFAAAAELWKLAGFPERSQRLQAIVVGGYERTPPRLVASDIRDLVLCLEGLEQAVVGPVTNAEHLIPLERLPELRAAAKTLALAEDRGDLARHAVEEALYDVAGLRFVLQRALAEGAEVLYG